MEVNQIVKTSNEKDAKAKAVMDFADIMIGALESGNISINDPITLAGLYQTARHHVKDNYGVETKNLKETWGEQVFNKCLKVAGSDAK